MRKKILLTVLVIASSFAAFAQFTAGNLAVYRYGNGTALVNGARVPVFVDEYNTAGTLVNTISISQTTSGANFGLNGLGLTSGGAYEAEGFPVLSQNGEKLVIFGYDAAIITSPFKFVVGIVDATGAVSSTTEIEEVIGAPRSAVVDGTKVYAHGNTAGVRYKELGASGASERISAAQPAPRVLTIAETSLNGIAGIKIFAPDAQTNFAFSNLVTTSTTFSSLNFSGTAPVSAHQVLVFKSLSSPARTLIYVIDDNAGSPLIRKYRSNLDGTSWIAFGTISVPLATKSITGTINANGVKLYYTTLGTPGNTDSKLYTYTDAFTSATDGSVSISGSGTLLATAAANTTFRGVTLAPVASVLPVSLISFKAQETEKAIKLTWSTASEKNSSHFDILRSFDGKDFQKIGSINAADNSASTIDYSFNDENPFPGVSYYKLQQFDKDGRSSLSGPVQINSKLEKTDFNIYASVAKSAADVWIYATVKQIAKISLISIGGQVLTQQSLNLEKGYNKFTLPVNTAAVGLQIAVLNAQSEVITKKFLWQ